MTLMDPGQESPPGAPSVSVPPPTCFVPVLRSGFCAQQGSRQTMEDAHVAIDNLSHLSTGRALCHPQGFYGVFDGHGGSFAAKYLQEALLENLMADRDFPLHVKRAMVNAFLRTDKELEKEWQLRQQQGEEADTGSTALAALVLGRTLYVANAGDCRAVISRRGKAVVLTQDHRAKSATERARVMAAGGTVVEDYLNDKLAVTRALGDWHMEDLKRRSEVEGATETTGPLIAEPEVFESVLGEGDEFMIIGCDGLWDSFMGQSQDVIEFARKNLCFNNDPLKCSQDLVAEALRRDPSDNITVVTVCFSSNPLAELSRRKPHSGLASGSRMHKSISMEALRSLQSCLNDP